MMTWWRRKMTTDERLRRISSDARSVRVDLESTHPVNAFDEMFLTSAKTMLLYISEQSRQLRDRLESM